VLSDEKEKTVRFAQDQGERQHQTSHCWCGSQRLSFFFGQSKERIKIFSAPTNSF